MPNAPTPRSRQQILGDMIATLLSRTGFLGLRVGGPVLSLLETAAQSDLRATQDIFGMLDSVDLNRATGIALDRIGQGENVVRQVAAPASGKVTIGDSSFTRIASTVYSGTVAPNAGSTLIRISNGASFPATGSIYLGRGTSNLEGPLAYTAIAQVGSYWEATLAAPTTKFHNVGESVVLAQGGIRSIAAGTAPRTSQANVTEAVSYSVANDYTLADGENELTDVLVVAQKPGIIGNAALGGIVEFASVPFSGATVTNPAPLTNGMATQSDLDYRESIRTARRTRAKGTALAVKNAVLNLEAPDESTRVVSASVVVRKDQPTTLYIDNGLGYEQLDHGVAYDVLMDSALGGEELFQLSADRPIAKAMATSGTLGPFALTSGMVLAVEVGGTLYEHTFSSEDFRAISSATPYEVIASINANSVLGFAARTAESNQRIVLSAKADTAEDLDVTAPSDPDSADANEVFDFPTGRIDTLKLYRNNRLLFKDGVIAQVASAPQDEWNPAMATGGVLTIDVDGTGPVSYTINDSDFVLNNTGYLTVAASNSLESWVTVLNAKIAGVTASYSGSRLFLRSNRGASATASIEIDPACTYVTIGQQWTSAYGLSDTGRENDYTLNRSLGQLRLSVALEEGERLTAGTAASRAYVEGDALTAASVTLTADATLWLVVDGAAEIVATGLSATTALTVSNLGASRAKYLGVAGTFTGLAVGDWMIVWDPAFTDLGHWRVIYVHGDGSYLKVQRATITAETATPTSSGIVFVRTAAQIQKVLVPLATYSIDQLVEYLNDPATLGVDGFDQPSRLVGCTASSSQNDRLRITTDTAGVNGDIMLVTADTSGQLFLIDRGILVSNEAEHFASVETEFNDLSLPVFEHTTVATAPSSTTLTLTAPFTGMPGFAWLRPWDAAGPVPREGSNRGSFNIPTAEVAGTWTYRDNSFTTPVQAADRVYPALPFSLAADDTLSIVLDNDAVNQNYQVPMFRRLKPAPGAIYGATFGVIDIDNGSAAPSVAFGTDFDLTDFSLMLQARVKSHLNSGNDQSILWRYARHGPDGEGMRVRYTNPTEASADKTVAVSFDTGDAAPYINLQLPSGAARATLLTDQVMLKVRFGRVVQYDTLLAPWTVGETVTGTFTGASGVILEDHPLAAPGTGYLVVGTLEPNAAPIDLAFTIADNLDGTIAGPGNAAVSSNTLTHYVNPGNGASVYYATYRYIVSSHPQATNMVTRTLGNTVTVDFDLLRHGYAAGDLIYMSAVVPDPDFPAGAKVVVDPAPGGDLTKLTYIEPGANVSNAQDLTSAPSATTPDFSVLVVGDIVTIGAGTSIQANNEGTYKITDKGATWFTVQRSTLPTEDAPPIPYRINAAANVVAYPIDTGVSLASDWVTFVNTPANGATDIVSAIAVEDGGGFPGTGTIGSSSADEVLEDTLTLAYWAMVDGMLQIRSSDLSVIPCTITTKTTPNADLALDSDFDNEDIRLVPGFSWTITRWLNSPAVSGLFAGTEILASSRAMKVQIASRTAGTDGAIQVSGGTANSVEMPIYGTAQDLTASGTCLVKKVEAEGLMAGWPALFQSINLLPKPITFAGTLDINVRLGDVMSVTSSVTDVMTQLWDCPDSVAWRVERHGRYVAYICTDGGSTLAADAPGGSWLYVKNATGASQGNLGYFRVIKSDFASETIWVENDNAVEEEFELTIPGTHRMRLYTADSMVPGDTFVIGDDSLGVANLGSWTVLNVEHADFKVFYVTGLTVTAGPVAATANLKVVEGEASRLIRTIANVYESPDDSNYYEVLFNDGSEADKISAARGTTLAMLGKLEFPTTLRRGVDGYAYTAGLIGECARVLYGDERDPDTYPGVLAAGTEINIQGPLIKRITCSFALRLRSGLDPATISLRVKSAVASEINRTGVGGTIAISDLVEAANRVEGVLAVTVLSPTYGVGNDLISVQAYEKPMVLDIDADISIKLVGS